MAFLAAVFSSISQWFLTNVWNAIKDAAKKFLRRRQIDSESAVTVKPLKEAKTGAEIDAATDSALDRW